MQTPHKIKSLFIFLFIIAASLTLLTSSHAGNLFIDPASPLVAVGGEITLTVTNASGEVKWSAFEGEIEKTGNSVKYKAPDYVAIDAVTAKDSAGNIDTAAVVIQEKAKIDERFSKENANWEIFTNRDEIHALLLSDDEKYLWVGTTGGLEKRDAVTGQLIQVFTNSDGLPSNDVNALLSDQRDGLWIGNYGGGLTHLKSDGTWQVFNKNNSGLPNDWITSLLSDGQDGLWVGTYGGLAHLKSDGSWQTFDEENSGLSDNYVLALLSDQSGGLWIGIAGGLVHLKSDGVFWGYSSGFPYAPVKTLISDQNGGLWIGTEGRGIAHTSNGKWQVFNEDNSELPDNWINSLILDGQNGLWIGTGAGLAHLKADNTWEIFNPDNSDLPYSTINTLISDGDYGLWIGNGMWSNGCGGNLLHWKKDNSFEILKTNTSELSYNVIRSLLSDGQGGLWVGTGDLFGGGLSNLKADGLWQTFNYDNSRLPDHHVDSLIHDGQGGLWAGTYGGLAHLKVDNTWEIFNSSNSDLPDNYVRFLLFDDGHNELWVGTNGGIAHYKADGSWQVFHKDNSGLPDNSVNTLLSDGEGGLWVGTNGGGIAHYKADGSWQVFHKDNSGLPYNSVSSLISDGQGGLWIGTGKWLNRKEGGGIAHLKADDSWEVFNTDNSELPSNRICSFLLDSQNSLWVGTDGGLIRFKDGNWDMPCSKDNSYLPDNEVNSMLSDGQNGLWVGTGNGLAHLTFSSSQIQDEQYLKNGRAAIIIAGGGNTDDNALWDSTAKISNYAYKMLNKRGFLNTDIHYISPQPFADFNGDGIDDKIVDAPNPARQIQLSDIQAAFDWAETKGTLNQPLYIFFTDHGGDSKLQLAQGVYIEASELKTMLDDYQKTTGNKVVFVIDACHSGTMVKALAGENRAIISSTNDGVAYFDRLNGQSFIWYVTKGLNKGMNFNEAFYYASSEYKKTLGKVSQYESISAGSDTLNLTQEPQFDDNGDGLYNISVDGNWLKTVSVNGTWSNADVTLTVEAVTQSSTILNSNTQTILKAKATLANGRVTRAWAVIRPPKMDILFDSTTGTPILAFPKIDLSSSTTEGEENIYQGNWNGFVYNGEYEITFYAEDNDKNIEGSESIILTVADGLACPEKGSLKVGVDKQPDATGKIVYKSDDKLKISVTENLAYGYDLYAALFMPDGNFTALKSPLTNANISYLQKENFNRLYWGDRWIDTNRNINMGKAVDVVDMLLPQEKLPAGQYCVYAALIPEGQDLMVAAGKGLIVLDGVCFEVVE